MTTTHYQTPGGQYGEAACGRHKRRGRGATTGLHTSSIPDGVDCCSCEKHDDVKAHKVAKAAKSEIARAYQTKFEHGDRVFGYNAHGTIKIERRASTRTVTITVVWDGRGRAVIDSNDDAAKFEVV